MTRLMRMLFPVCTLGLIWLALVTGIVPVNLSTAWWQVLTPLPFYALIVFGCYSLATVGYNVYCVKSDDQAASHLLKDIDEAKKALKKKGFIFD